jgi:hypothetical protein
MDPRAARIVVAAGLSELPTVILMRLNFMPSVLALAAALLLTPLSARATTPGWGCVSSSYCDEAALNDIIKEALSSYGIPAFTAGGRPGAARLETLALRLDKAIARISLIGDGIATQAGLVLEYDASAQPGAVIDGAVSSLRSLVHPTYIGVIGGMERDDRLLAYLAGRLQRTFERAANRVLGRQQTAEQVWPVVSRLLSGKIMYSEDGVLQQFGGFDPVTASIKVKVTQPDGAVVEVVGKVSDTLHARAALLIETVIGGGDSIFDIRVDAGVGYTATPVHAEDTNVVSRSCRGVSEGKTECVLTRREHGELRRLVFREFP